MRILLVFYKLSTIIYSLCRGVIYKNSGILLGECLTVKNQWELLTGGDVSDLVWSIGV